MPRIHEGEEINWFDIGCGDCLKTDLHAEILLRKEVKIARIMLIDPDLPAILPLAFSRLQTLLSKCREIRLLSSSLATIADEPFSSISPSTTLATAVHSIHDHACFHAFVTLLKAYHTQRRRLIAFLVSESTDSDLFEIRTRIASIGVKVPRPFISEIETAARLLGSNIIRSHVGEQFCKIYSNDIASDDSHWLFPFVMGEPAASFSKRPLRLRKKILEICRDFIRGLDRKQLSIPDEALLIELSHKDPACF